MPFSPTDLFVLAGIDASPFFPFSFISKRGFLLFSYAISLRITWDPHAHFVQERQEQSIACVGTGIKQTLNLLAGECFRGPALRFERNDASRLRVGFGNAMQKGFVPSTMRQSELGQRKFRNGREPHMVGVEPMDRPQG